MPIGIPIPLSQQSPYTHASSAYRQYNGNMQVEYRRLRRDDDDGEEDEENEEDADDEEENDDENEEEKEMDEEEEVNVVVTALARGQLSALLEGSTVQQSPRPPCWGDSYKCITHKENRMHIIKQQQQRLLLLRHASKCPQNGGRCPVTPHCASMKQLWKHITTCHDENCKVPHCVSSRYVLSHYSTCMDQACPVCKPAQEANRMNPSTTPPPTNRPNPKRRTSSHKTVKRSGEWDCALCFTECWSRYKAHKASSSSSTSTS